ncbi:MAG: phospholipid scramblase-related protein [Anaeromyxobacter sp.]
MAPAARFPSVHAPLEDTLDSARRIVVRQSRDWSELIGVEAANRYALLTESGALAGWALEQPGNWFIRMWLKARRPFEMDVVAGEADQRPALRLSRPWTFWFARLEVRDGGGRSLGAIQERFSILRRRFDLVGADGQLLARLIGPLWKPWTFLLHPAEGEREVGRIEKRWSGLTSELFTDADTFLVTLPQSSPALRRLTLAAAVVIDFKFFENDE